MNRDLIIDLFRHMEWADALVWTAILKHEPARDDTKIREWLYHTHMVQRSFLRIWRGEDPSGPYPKFEKTEDMQSWAKTHGPESLAHVSALTDGDLTKPFALPWAAMIEKRLGKKPESTNVCETALQVAMHTVHHRAQVVARLRELGGEPPLSDYIAWLWLGRPAPQWPS